MLVTGIESPGFKAASAEDFPPSTHPPENGYSAFLRVGKVKVAEERSDTIARKSWLPTWLLFKGEHLVFVVW